MMDTNEATLKGIATIMQQSKEETDESKSCLTCRKVWSKYDKCYAPDRTPCEDYSGWETIEDEET